MKIRVLTLRLDPETGCFDDGPVEAFFAAHEALAVREHFFVHEGAPSLALVVRDREVPAVPVAVRRDEARSGASAPPIAVAEADQGLFSALRAWRNARARRDGRPAYVLFTNAQLGAIAALRPATRAALAAVDGVGEARVRDYADEVLAVVAATPPGVEPGAGEAAAPRQRLAAGGGPRARRAGAGGWGRRGVSRALGAGRA